MSIEHFEDHFRPDAFVGIYDYSYAPLALGDAATWQMNLCLGAVEHGLQQIVQYLIADPTRQFSAFSGQRYLTANTYLEHFSNLFPVFLSCPNTRAIHWVKDKAAFDLFFLRKIAGRVPTWPSAASHFRGHLDVQSQTPMNLFHRRHGYIPRLNPPRGYEASMDAFLGQYCRNRFVVCVNIRQRKFQPTAALENATSFARDSALDEWYRFFRIVEREYPDVLFVTLGGYSHWARELYTYSNMLILRTMGYHLPHELTLIHRGDLFMGSLSGFAAYAIFTTVPFILTRPLLSAAGKAGYGIEVGQSTFEFALEHQTVCWEEETADRLLRLFESVYLALRPRSRSIRAGSDGRDVVCAG